MQDEDVNNLKQKNKNAKSRCIQINIQENATHIRIFHKQKFDVCMADIHGEIESLNFNTHCQGPHTNKNVRSALSSQKHCLKVTNSTNKTIE